jgi:hypothetical protein
MDDASAASRPPSTAGAGAGSASGPLASAEWPARLADLVEAVVTALHDKVVRPLLVVARAVVFGLVVAAMALVIAVLGSIAVVRLLDSYAFGRRVWASDLVVGGFLTLIGLVAWSRRRARHAEER